MDIQAPAGVGADRTPLATKAALVSTLAATAAGLGAFVSSGGDRAGLLLFFLTGLFLLRVAGQLLVLARPPRWLPPMDEWNFVPYRLLLPVQLVLLGLMSAISVAVASGWRPGGAAVLAPLSFAYWGAMVGRYAVRMARRPGERWFGGAVPIVFHFVLAAFLFVLASAGP